MTIFDFLFWFFIAATVVSAFFLAFSKNIVHSAYAFLAVLLGVACLYVFAGAEFVAVTQLMVYIGGVLVLVVFGVMLTAGYTYVSPKVSWAQSAIAAIIALAVTAGGLYVAFQVESLPQTELQTALAPVDPEKYSAPQSIGYLLMTDYLLPFEASGILLMVALLGAATIAARLHKNSA